MRNKTQKTAKTKIDNALNLYEDQVLFPKRLEETNQMLRNVGLPKAILVL